MFKKMRTSIHLFCFPSIFVTSLYLPSKKIVDKLSAIQITILMIDNLIIGLLCKLLSNRKNNFGFYTFFVDLFIPYFFSGITNWDFLVVLTFPQVAVSTDSGNLN